MATRVGGPGSPPAGAKASNDPKPDDTESDDDLKADADDWAKWQELGTTPTLRKGDEGNVLSKSRSRNVDYERSTKGRSTTTTRTSGDEEKQTSWLTKSRQNKNGTSRATTKTRNEKTERGGMTKEGNVVLGGWEAVHQKDFGDKRHHVVGHGPLGTTTDAYAQGPSLSLSGIADAQMHGWSGVDVNLQVRVDAKALNGGASITKDIPFEYRGQHFDAIIRLGANAEIGANGDINLTLHLGKDGAKIEAGADGFVGAKGSLMGSAEIDMNDKELVGGELQVTFAAGAMAGASFEGNLQHFHASAYAAVGAGVGVDLSGEVYAKNIAQALPRIISER